MCMISPWSRSAFLFLVVYTALLPRLSWVSGRMLGYVILEKILFRKLIIESIYRLQH